MVLSFLVAVPRINLFWHSSQRQSKRRIGNARFSSFRPKAPEAGSSAARLCVKLAKRDQAVIEQRIQRQLIAILAADVAGYSRLIGLDEEGTLARLKELRRTLIDPKIEEHRGRIVKTMGDGLLVQFASAVDAVQCAADIQQQMAEQSAGTDKDRLPTS
jgi:class 3 adenylate cyclase